jgi:hypothetical protein
MTGTDRISFHARWRHRKRNSRIGRKTTHGSLCNLIPVKWGLLKKWSPCCIYLPNEKNLSRSCILHNPTSPPKKRKEKKRLIHASVHRVNFYHIHPHNQPSLISSKNIANSKFAEMLQILCSNHYLCWCCTHTICCRQQSWLLYLAPQRTKI